MATFSFINILTVAFILPNILTASDVVSRIVGGQEVSITDYPYQVSFIIYTGSYPEGICGGSIIGRNHILTAAHCLDSATKIFIRAGSDNSERGGQTYEVKNVGSAFTMHPQYDIKTLDYDIAIVRLVDPIVIDGVTTRIMQLPEADYVIEPGSNLNVSGWGLLSQVGANSTNKLMAITVPVTTDEYCRESYVEKITSRMFCAGFDEGKKDACMGDSGGPAVHNSIQVGIVSFGNGCAKPNAPTVYVKVPILRKWIKEVTGI